ncbi:uncharacterized protein LOC106880144 [Octopus bimaculoides]|uniref:BZIP domain-containing protein n=1 Tax=Octopus bimaculoides TaxID=37653 RepID=A0A0L8G0Q5_OCTBM|nr:uncharacterized protein LOC106880144 [Octopus bimaculoides]|eukprot:XP_014785465.1 PREDICTED: uncharacterized protein LOC106880144 [Octopus bimaculoides]
MNGLFNRGSSPNTKLRSFDVEENLLTEQFPSDLDSLLLSNDISKLLLPLDADSSQKYLDENIAQGVGSTETSFDSDLLLDSQTSLLESEPLYEHYSELDKMLEILSPLDDQKLEFYQETNQKLSDTSEIDPLLEVYSEPIGYIAFPDAEEKLKIYPTVDEKPSLYTGLNQNIKTCPMIDQNSKTYPPTNEILEVFPEQGKKQITSTHQNSQKVCLKQVPENKVTFKRQSYTLPHSLLLNNSHVVGTSSSSSSTTTTVENHNCSPNKKLRLAGEISNTAQISVSNRQMTTSSLTAGEMSAIEKYNERRRRNNIASRKSRENRKKKNQSDLKELEELGIKNENLKLKVKDLEECLEKTKAELVKALM